MRFDYVVQVASGGGKKPESGGRSGIKGGRLIFLRGSLFHPWGPAQASAGVRRAGDPQGPALRSR